MKSTIEVKDREEASRIKAALENSVFRATANVVGALMPLSSRARARTMAYVQDHLDEEQEMAAKDATPEQKQ